ncbi:MAG TPA: hypothetical protein VFR15_02265 [Chloroflexia bacterium]|nr:hypothetical protein [Chloroflexia bacterium]
MLRQNEYRSELFTLRVWPEEITGGQVEWRGKIQRVTSGESTYFHSWEAMMSFLLTTLEAGLVTSAPDEEEPR